MGCRLRPAGVESLNGRVSTRMCCRAMDPDRPLFNKKLLFMKRMKTTCNYEAPKLHVELLAVERGFALSGSTIDEWENGGGF